MNPRLALFAGIAVVGFTAAVLPALHLYPTVLSLVGGLFGWGTVALVSSGQYADGHFSAVWVAVTLVHMILFGLPGLAIWKGLRDRQASLSLTLLSLWCLCYLSFLLALFPAANGP